MYILIALSLGIPQQDIYKSLDCWSRNTLNFDFLENGLRLDSPPNSLYDFLRKMFLMLNSIIWPKSNV